MEILSNEWFLTPLYNGKQQKNSNKEFKVNSQFFDKRICSQKPAGKRNTKAREKVTRKKVGETE